VGKVYYLVNTAKAKFLSSRLVLSGLLRSKGVKWQRVGATNDRLERVAGNVGTTFVDPNIWMRASVGMDLTSTGMERNNLATATAEIVDCYCRDCRLLLQRLWTGWRKSEDGKQLTTHVGEWVQ
jgi:hypothetical protein